MRDLLATDKRSWPGTSGEQVAPLGYKVFLVGVNREACARYKQALDALLPPAWTAAFQDYVIAHELLHLRVPNHGPLFKALLTAHVPAWRRYELTR